MFQYSCLENTPPWQRSLAGQVYRLAKSRTQLKWPCAHRHKTFFPVAALSQWELNVKVAQLLDLQGTWGHQLCRDTTGIRALSVFFESLVAGNQKSSLDNCSISPPIQALRGFPCLESFSVVQCIRCIEESPWLGSYSVVPCNGCLMNQPLYCSAANAGVWGERGYGDGSTHYAWLSSIALLLWLPGFPPLAILTMISSFASPQSVSLQSTAACNHPGIAPQSLNSSSQPLRLPGGLCPCLGCVGCSKDCLIPIPFRLPQISCFTLSLKYFSDSDNCPNMGIGLLLQFPHPPRAGPVLLTLLFFPLFLCPTEFCVGLYILFHW